MKLVWPSEYLSASIFIHEPPRRIESANLQSRWLDHDPSSTEPDHGSNFLFAHDLFRKPVSTFRDHALRRLLRDAVDLLQLLAQVLAGNDGRIFRRMLRVGAGRDALDQSVVI